MQPMNWTRESIEQYVSAKEYIDTLLIPLTPLDFKNDQNMIKSASEREYLNVLSYEIEQQLTGRVLQLPEYVYIKNDNYNGDIDRLNEWSKMFNEDYFKHVFYLTLDINWRKHEKSLNGNFLWFPSVTSDHPRSAEMKNVVRDQVEQISDLIRSYWT